MIRTILRKPGEEMENEKLEISVNNPQKVGNGLSAYVVYNVTTVINYPSYMKKTVSVSRRFSDFLGLYEKLVEKHLPLGRIVPPPPGKSVKGMTKVKISTDQTMLSVEFIEPSRAALERYMNRTACHPVLRADPDFRHFLETESNLPKATNTSVLNNIRSLKFFNRVGEAVVKMTFTMDEPEPWFKEKQCQIEVLDQQLRKLHNSFEAQTQHRKELSKSAASLSKYATPITNSEELEAFSRAFLQIGDVEGMIQEFESQQANYDFYLLSELLKDYVGLIAAIKEVFYHRFKVYQSLRNAEEALTELREEKAELKLTNEDGRILKVRVKVTELEAKVQKRQDEFENISKTIREEVERFEQTRIEDFKNTVAIYVQKLLGNRYQAINGCRSFLAIAKSVAGN